MYKNYTHQEDIPFELQKLALKKWWHYEYANWIYHAIKTIARNEWWEETEDMYIEKMFY